MLNRQSDDTFIFTKDKNTCRRETGREIYIVVFS